MLATGTRLGPYEIVAPLGAGGMGEVYRARDTRLSRDVAVKVLPQHLSRQPEVRARFEREARAISSLNHPHICVLHDVGREGETDYLVMELVEGETLSKRLARGPLPLVEVLRLGSQVAEALARAHRAGVVHRDLKPGNIMVTKAGAKLMDFGLARSSRSALRPEEATQAPTETAPITGEGRILGTVPYMAPEQLEGREADARSDIWALGCVLYEMATGTRAFGGSSTASVMSAILRDEPAPLASRAPASPPALERLIRSCLAKDANDRWQSAGDLARELRWMAGGGGAESTSLRRAADPRAWVALAVLVVIALAAALQLSGRAPWSGRSRRQTWSTLELPAFVSSQGLSNGNYALSPDGGRVAAVVADSAGLGKLLASSLGRLYVRTLSRPTWLPLAQDEDVLSPFWSPDSREIGFVTSQGKLERVGLTGGAPQFICKTGPDTWCATWSRSGWIVFGYQGGGRPLMKVRASGGTVALATAPQASRHEVGCSNPVFLPDGKHFLFSVQVPWSPEAPNICVGSLDQSGSRPLMRAQTTPQSDGHGNIVFMRNGVLYRQGIAGDGSRLLGEPTQLEEAPTRYSGLGGAVSRVARNRLVYIPADDRPTDLVWFRRDGFRLERAARMSEPVERPVLSPDGQRVLAILASSQGEVSIWLANLATGSQRRLTDPDGLSSAPRWTTSGGQFSYSARSPGEAGRQVWLMDPDAPESTRVIAPGGFAACWEMGDREVVLVRGASRSTQFSENSDLVLHDIAGDIPDRGYAVSPASEGDCLVFDGGRHAAYVSDASGRFEVYCDDFPIRHHAVQLTEDGCMPSHPAVPRFWFANNEIFYLAEANKLRSVTLRREGDEFVRGAARTLFELPPENRGIALSPDGQRVLVALPAGGPRPASLTLVDNWDAPPDQR